MALRMVAGKLAGGDYGIRVSLPGYDVFGEGFGSRNISFDTRITEIGTVVSAGLIQCGGAAISFPAMPYVPLFKLCPWDGNIYTPNQIARAPIGGVASNHTWIPAVGVITNSSLQVVSYTNSNYDPRAFYNPDGSYFLYYVLADGG